MQCEYLMMEPAQRSLRAKKYLEYRHIEAKRLIDNVRESSSPIARLVLAESGAAVQDIERHFHRVSVNYNNSWRGWHGLRLSELAKATDCVEEYLLYVTQLHGSVHASTFSTMFGSSLGVPGSEIVAIQTVCRLTLLCEEALDTAILSTEAKIQLQELIDACGTEAPSQETITEWKGRDKNTWFRDFCKDENHCADLGFFEQRVLGPDIVEFWWVG